MPDEEFEPFDLQIQNLEDQIKPGVGMEGDTADINSKKETGGDIEKGDKKDEDAETSKKLSMDEFSNESDKEGEGGSELKDEKEDDIVEDSPVQDEVKDEVADEVEDELVDKEGELDPAARNFDNFKRVLGEDYDAEVFRQASNEAFNAVGEIVKSLATERSQTKALTSDIETVKRQLSESGVLPSSYLQHEQGFIFEKDYLDLAQKSVDSDQVIAHWQQQLNLISAGEQWNGLEINPATGLQQVSVTPSEASAVSASQVNQALQNAIAIKAQSHQKVTDLQNKFEVRRQGYQSDLKQTQDKYFSWHRTADGQRKKYAINTGEEFSVEDIKRGFIAQLPNSLKDIMPTDIGADMYVTIQNYSHHIKVRDAEIKRLKTLAKEKKVNGKKLKKTGSSSSKSTFNKAKFDTLSMDLYK